MEDIEVYYKSHGKKVYYYLLSMVHDDNLAQELTQETFYQAMKTINKYRGIVNLLYGFVRLLNMFGTNTLKRIRNMKLFQWKK